MTGQGGKCWKELVDALTENFETTCKFLFEDCTANEASWLPDVYDDIIHRTQSREYIELLLKPIEHFPEENRKYHMSDNLDIAMKSILIKN